MRVIKLQSNQPLVSKDGYMTAITAEIMERLITEVIELRTQVNDLEARVTALEP